MDFVTILRKLLNYFIIFLCLIIFIFIFLFLCQTRYLGAIGGQDVTDTTRRVLRACFKNALACKLNYVGRGEKFGVKNLKITAVITGLYINVFRIKNLRHI